eukprot:CAMPEP_0182427644 /NCGR_PEP_ID=MMETSP1167-20130531/18942_1 /TAXON_ID=2988 /ORGANISM="Mallomonas Sp, Strain CCMP3275" /LENGTH=126 /DNA_ID=CAMNT_0024610025 /DNA_START=175 /DNA_END=552 /DNA_ORIENTATION=-
MIDLAVSAVIGVVLAISIIVFFSYYPGKAFDYSTGEYIDLNPNSSQSSKEKANNNETDEDTTQLGFDASLEQLSEEDFLKKAGSLQKFLGLSEDDIRKAVRKTNKQISTGKLEEPEHISWAKCLDW